MNERLARAAYSALLRLLLPLVFLRLWWRGRREPLYRRHWIERLGGRLGAPAAAGSVWLHAVSLGETRAATALVDALRRRRPGVRLLLTHGTATGRAAGTALLRDGDAQAWLPWDTPGAVRRFLRLHRPAVGVLMETEVWPNLLHGAAAASVPVVLANARLSARSLRKARRTRVLLRPAVATFARVLAQTDADAERLRTAGAAAVTVAGNLKFDVTPPAAMLRQGRRWRAAVARPVVLAASLREGEDAPLLHAWLALPAPRPLLLLVPRHPQRFAEVAAAAAATGLRVARRSVWRDGEPPTNVGDVDVLIGDSIGEMPLYYAASDVALLGGSFAPLGGQNLIEAAACGCPIVMGPHTFNFEQAAGDALDAGAAERVPSIDAGVRRAVAMAVEPAAERDARSRRAAAFAATHRGAAERMADAIVALLPRR